MATKIDQKAYLQKYLGGPSGDKKKKKKKVVKGNGLKIIDDDIDLTKLRPLEVDELDIYGEGEDAPQVAGIIDERPEELRKLEEFKTTTKWKVINQDDGFNSQVRVQEIKIDIEEVKKENEIIFGKMYSDSEDDKKNDSDPSPPRQQSKQIKTENNAKPQNNSDSDFSPPRRQENQKTAPPRNDEQKSDSSSKKHEPRKERVRKPSRWGDSEDSKSDRNHSESQKSRSPKRKEYKREKSSDSDISPPRKSRRNNDSDVSPPRKSRKDSKRKPVDSDASPPRKKQTKDRRRDKRNNSSDSDLSPPRKNRPYSDRNSNQGQGSRQSPERRRKHESDSDQSPPRKRNGNEKRYRRDSSSPPPTSKRMERTLEGKMAGLQDARQLRKENNDFRDREEQAFKRMTDEVSGRNAQAVSRKSKRETSADRQKQIEKAERQKVIDEKYKKWSKGIKQQQDQDARAQEFLHEASKPLARYKDDTDLEGRLKDIERDGDPMLKYIRERKRERGELGPEKPSYKGSFPPNRFNIRPGYRWDGVDRSNGYEKKYFDQQSKRKAQEEEAYKWSTEDL